MNEGLVGLFGRAGAGGVKSVQQVSVSVISGASSASTAINVVNPNKTVLVPLGMTTTTSTLTESFYRLSYNATSVTVACSAALTNSMTVNVLVVEFY